MSAPVDKSNFVSARFWMAIMVVLTLCATIILAAIFWGLGKITDAQFGMIFGTFSSIATMIVKSYFDKMDKTDKNGASSLDQTVLMPPKAGCASYGGIMLTLCLCLLMGCASVSYTDSRGNSFHKVAFLANTDIGYMTATLATNGITTIRISKYSQDEVKGAAVAADIGSQMVQAAVAAAVKGAIK